MIVQFRSVNIGTVIIRIDTQAEPEIEESTFKDCSANLYITAASLQDAARMLTEYTEKNN